MIKSAADLIAAASLRTAVVDVCGVQITVRELSVADRGRMIAAASGNPAQLAALVVQMGAVSPDGTPLFSADEVQQVAALRSDLISGIMAAVLKISGLSETPPKD